MNIQEIQAKEQWDAFVQSQPDYTFLNAWAWGEFQQASGNKIWRLGMFADDELMGAALVISVAARRGRFLFVPHGPLIIQNSEVKSDAQRPQSLRSFVGEHSLRGLEYSRHPEGVGATEESRPIIGGGNTARFFASAQNDNRELIALIDYLKKIAHQERCSFIRISPLLPKTSENEQIFQDLKFRPAPMHMHAETTWVLDIRSSQDLILKNMRKTTRYLVRRGEKDGAEVVSGTGEKLFEEFCHLYRETARRQHFVPFSRDYIAEEMAAFGDENACIYLARVDGHSLAGAVIIIYGNRAFYHHGASLHHPSASYLLQWRIIQDLKARGITEYNFWGVDFRPKHPWQGVTLFKSGFGGQARAYLPAQDLGLKPSYWLSYGIETFRRLWRRY